METFIVGLAAVIIGLAVLAFIAALLAPFTVAIAERDFGCFGFFFFVIGAIWLIGKLISG